MNKKAFTLIELLVVVLIIGILSAIALPQYRVAVAKARFVQLMVAGKALKDAQLRYKLANDKFAVDFNDLDVGLAGTPYSATHWSNKGYSCSMVIYDGDFSYLWCGNSDHLAWFWSPGINNADCYAYDGDSVAEKVCLSFGGTVKDANGCNGSCKIYSLP